MTREEIIAMKPGKKLDALVAENIMGGQRFHYFIPGGDIYEGIATKQCQYGQGWENLLNYNNLTWGKAPVETVVGAYYVPDYSDDMSAIWEVVKKIESLESAEALTTLRIRLTHWSAREWKAEFIEKISGKTFEALAPTMPEAICKVALLVKLEL